MQILPVIDLKAGQVVRGVAGRRDEYRPVQSLVAADARPATVATAFAETFGFRRAYVADLDAISGAAPAWEAYRSIAGAGLTLWIDAGLSGAAEARELVEPDLEAPFVEGVIAGLESVPDPRRLAEIFQAVGPERAIFSLDLQDGRLLSTSSAWRDRTPLEVAACAVELGFRRLLVLDLADVGVGRGPRTLDLCCQVRAAHPDVELTAGGGVRQRDDVQRLARAGCDAVLVASALHDGRIRPGELA